MANIKCRYREHRCRHGEFTDACWNDELVDCKYFTPDKEQMKNYPNLVNPSCDHIITRNREFEKTCKNYVYDEGDMADGFDGYLEIGKKVISTWSIDFLEIDGRILIDREESEGGE